MPSATPHFTPTPQFKKTVKNTQLFYGWPVRNVGKEIVEDNEFGR